MADRHTKEQRSFNMSKIRSTNTKLELVFFDLLDQSGIDYEKHPMLFGKPDCLIGGRIAVFVDSDFWHGWQFNQWKSRLTSEYWVPKIERNMRRDQLKFRKLRRMGYIVIRVWDHSLKRDPGKVIMRIKLADESPVLIKKLGH